MPQLPVTPYPTAGGNPATRRAVVDGSLASPHWESCPSPAETGDFRQWQELASSNRGRWPVRNAGRGFVI